MPGAPLPRALRYITPDQTDRPLEVLSFACGPERVMRQYFADGGANVNLTLCDFDPGALKHARAEIDKAAAAAGNTAIVRTIKASAFDMIRDPGSISGLVSTRPDGRYDIITVLGLLDYLSDDQITAFLDSLTGLLAPGGVCLLSNVHSVNPWRALMEYGGDWNVIHREATAFGALAAGDGRFSTVDLRTDATGTNVFFAGVKA